MKRMLLGFCLVFAVDAAFASYLAETQEVRYLNDHKQVQEEAVELGGAVEIYEYVRNRFRYTPYHGSRSHSLATYFAGRGNDVDLASLTIAMYRSVGIPARYVEGVIQVKSPDVMAWLGVESRVLAETIMLQQGIISTDAPSLGQVPVYDESEDAYSFHHTWIEVLLPVDGYRGVNTKTSGLCETEGSGCMWIGLDPSFKKVRFDHDAINLLMDQVVDSDEFFQSLYDAEKSGNPDYAGKSPLEIYESKILSYLEVNHPGSSISDVEDKGVIAEDRSGLLPLSMPYLILSIKRKFGSISERDASLDASEYRFQKKASTSLVHSESKATIIDNFDILLSDIVDSRVLITFENCVTDYCDVRVRRDGEIAHSVAFSQSGLERLDLVRLTVNTDHASPFHGEISAVYPTTHVGGMYAVAAGGYASSWGLVHGAIDRLLAYHEQYPTSVAADNTVYIDANKNGQFDGGEELVNDEVALEALSGSFLDVAIKLYFAKFYDAYSELQGIHKVNMPISTFIGVTSTKSDVNYIDGSAFLVNPKGLLIDLKGMAFNGSWLRDQDNVYYNDHFELLSHIGSSLEHEVWQELTGFDAISTVRGFQWVREADSSLVASSSDSTAGLDRVDCYRMADVILQLLANITNPNTNEPYTGMPMTYTWEQIHGAYVDAYGNDSDGTPKINLADMVAFVSNDSISLSSQITSLPLCNGVSESGSFQTMREILFENARTFAQGGVIPPRQNYRFGSVGTYIAAPAFLSGMISETLRESYASVESGATYTALTPAIANNVDGNSYSVYSSKKIVSELPNGEPVLGNPLVVSIQMGLADGTLTSQAGGGLVLFPESHDWYGLSNSCDPSNILCGGNMLEIFNDIFFGEDYSIGFTHNDIFQTPSTWDPVNTVTGNMYHDEKDFQISGRSLSYTFTRTYNSKESLGGANWSVPFSDGWTHSYNVRLIDNDGIKYIDERGATYDYESVSGTVFAGVQEISALALIADEGANYVMEVLGDVDGDQHGDAAFLKRVYDSVAAIYSFELFSVEGNGDGTYQTPVQLGSYQSNQAGQEVVIPLGDMNQDGYKDVLFNFGGTPRLFLGSLSGLSESTTSLPGAKYAYAGDVNGDGYKDLARFETSGVYQGLAIYYGSASGFNTASPQVVLSSLNGHASHYDAIRTALDLNGDGYDDIIVNHNNAASGDPLAEVYLGSMAGLATQPATSAIFTDGMTSFPNYTFAVGDLNGDSYPDVVSRLPYQEGPALDVYLNNGVGFSAADRFRIHLEGKQGGGSLISPLGDQNGDGFAEFATSLSKEDVTTGTYVTYYSVYSGNPVGVQSAPVWEFSVSGVYAGLLTGSAYSYPVYLSGEAKDLAVMSPSELRTVSFQSAQVADVSSAAICEKEVVINWKGTGDYMLPFCNGTKYIFSPMESRHGETAAKLENIQDAYGNELVFGYDTQSRLSTVTDNLGIAGRTGLQFSYYTSGAAEGKLESIIDWTGRAWTYEYDASGRLSAVVPPAGQAWKTSYTYVGDTHLLRQVIKPEDRDGQQHVVTFEYYENGRAYRYVNTVGDAETVDYDIFSTSSRITHPDGGVMVHDYDGSGQLERVVNPDGGVIRYANTADHKRYSKKSPLGYETAYSYRQDRSISALESDTNGLVTRERDALGNYVDYDYGIHSQPTFVRDKRGNERDYVYYDVTNESTGALKGKLHKVMATINGQAGVVLEEYTYFAHGGVKRKVEYIDQADAARKRVTDFTYVNNGLNIGTITISGATDAATYGSDAVTNQVTFTYDVLGRVQTKTIGRRASAIDATLMSLVTTYGYDTFDRLVSETDPLGNITETVYDKNGKAYQVKFHHKHSDGSFTIHTQTTNYYDAYDRLIRTVDIDAGETRYTYGPTVYAGKSDLIAVTDANGNKVRHEYDKMHRRIATVDGNGRRTEFRYDQSGNLVKVINPLGQSMSYKYDPLGRQTLAITHTGETAEQRYDASGNVTHVLDANAYALPVARNTFGASLYREYDEFNRVVREVNAEDGETLYAYDLLGNLTSLTDPENQLTQFVYDDMGLLRKVVDPIVETPADLTVTFTYDEVGNRLTVTDRKGEVTRFTYDALNRLTKTEYLADGTEETRVYDELGNLLSVSSADVTYSYTYDDKHRVTSRTDSRLGLSLSWTYDAAGNIKTKTDYQGSVTTYQYDGGNRLIATVNPDYVHARYAYDGAGRILSRTLSNGARTTYAYNAAGRLETLTNLAADGQVVSQQTFTYDLVGNIASINDGTNTVVYGYDKLYRLTGADYPGTADDLLYTYDLVGNRETFSVGGSTRYYQYTAGNHLAGIYQDATYTTPMKTYQYDANGNRTQVLDADGATVLQSLAFNQRGFVDTVSTPAGAYAFAYDPLGYRIQRAAAAQTNLYMLEGEHLEAIYSPGGQVQSSYHRGSLIDEIVNGFDYSSGTKTNFTVHHDHLNSVTALTDHNGQPWQSYQYDPFGNPLNTAAPQVPNDFTYTGREWDGLSGLYYYRARYYDPEVGRFISEDPLGFEAGINFYAYVDNRPLLLTDPTGKAWQEFVDTMHWEFVAPGDAYGRVVGAAKAELQILAGAAQATLAIGSGSFVFGSGLAAHGVGNYLGGIGDLQNQIYGGTRDWNVTKDLYEYAGDFYFNNPKVGEAGFYAMDLSMGISSFFTSVTKSGSALVNTGTGSQPLVLERSYLSFEGLAQPSWMILNDVVGIADTSYSLYDSASSLMDDGSYVRECMLCDYPSSAFFSVDPIIYGKNF